MKNICITLGGMQYDELVIKEKVDCIMYGGNSVIYTIANKLKLGG